MPRSQNNELAGGFTHYRIITSDEVVSAQDTGDSVITAFAIPAGTVLKDVCVKVNRGFYENASGDSTAFSYVAGDSDDADGFITQQAISADGDGPILAGSSGMVAWNSGAYFIGTDSAGATTGNVVNGKAYSTANIVKVTVSSDSNFTNLQDGELFVGANILDPSAYAPS
jgi:hypothetical protein